VGEEMSDDLIKRSDVLFIIDAFKRDFEQSWKVQFSADIKALPAVDLSERIEQLEAKLAEAEAVAKIWQEDFIQENNRWGDALRKLEKAVEIGNKMAASIKGNYYIPNVVAEWNAVLAELEGWE
jgi:hypothetical protein